MRNHLGSYECKLCLTLHTNEASYLTHTQGKKHTDNLKRRAFKEAQEAGAQAQLAGPALAKPVDKKKFVKIGRPGYKVTKQRDPLTEQNSMLFQIDYPEIADGVEPKHRFMSGYEQKLEAPDKDFQFLLFAAEPYETIGFKISSRELDKTGDKFWTFWNKETKTFFLQFHFKADRTEKVRGPILPPGTPKKDGAERWRRWRRLVVWEFGSFPARAQKMVSAHTDRRCVHGFVVLVLCRTRGHRKGSDRQRTPSTPLARRRLPGGRLPGGRQWEWECPHLAARPVG